VWAILTWPIVRLAGESLAAEVVGYKLLALLAYVGCCALIWTSVEPERRARALVLFAWSPLVLIDVLGKVHNDVLPALAALLAVWLLSRRHATLSMLSSAAGGLVKATAWTITPALALFAWRRSGPRAALVALAAAAALVAALYAPFWSGPQTLLPIWQQTSRVVWSPATLLMAASETVTGDPHSQAVRLLLAGAWAIACGVLLWRAQRSMGDSADSAEPARSSAWLVLLSVLLLGSAVFAHHLVPAVALAAVAGDRRLERVVFWLSLGALAAYATELMGAGLAERARHVLGTLVLVGPASLAMLIPRRARAAARP
jgi:hypothetical protein